jgi:FtsP/CotA-like multicopper oxidase with cupredoxin domain
MRSRSILAIAAVIALAACGGGGSSSSPAIPPNNGNVNAPPALPAIPEVPSQNGVASVSLQAAFDSAGRPAFFWNGQAVAPTIRVQPGDSIHLHFVNSLPEFCAVGVASNSNLHFHGLTSSPQAPGDDVITTNAAPGAAVDYVININTDQPPGMYWYHPHPHGLTSWEVGNGMAGVIVVEGIANEVPQTAGLRERVIILGAVPNDPSFSAGESSVARRRASAVRARTQDADAGGDPCRPDTETTPMINGLPMASIGIRPGETQLFRVLNASGHRFFDLSVDGRQLTLVAQDGVPIHDYPGAPATIPMNDVLIPPAGRVEFLVTGGSAPAALTSNCVQTGPAGDPAPSVVLGVLRDDGTSASTSTSRVRAPLALVHSQFYRTALPPPAAQHTIHFQEDANGFYLDGQQYQQAGPPSIVSKAGTVEEWTLENDTDELHAFHLHQVHFVVESVNGVDQPNPHWVDTFTLVPQGHGASGQVIPSRVKVLIDFRDPIIKGIFLYHCHILDHEDGGMAAKIQVI